MRSGGFGLLAFTGVETLNLTNSAFEFTGGQFELTPTSAPHFPITSNQVHLVFQYGAFSIVAAPSVVPGAGGVLLLVLGLVSCSLRIRVKRATQAESRPRGPPQRIVSNSHRSKRQELP